MTDDLVTRLRASRVVWENGGHRPTDDELEAAARIEADAATIARLEGAWWQNPISQDAVARAEAAEAKVARLEGDVNWLRLQRANMHRRAQRAEGKAHRSAHLLETILRSIKDVIPMLPTLPSPYPLSLHSLYQRVCAARDHARASSGRAWIEGWHYWRKYYEDERRRADDAEAKVAALVEALNLAANRLLSCSVDYDTGTLKFIETGEWAEEARAAIAAAKGGA